MRKPTIAIVGAGNLARALAPALRRSGYRVRDVIVRDRTESRGRGKAVAKAAGAQLSTTSSAAKIRTDLLWICVTDDAIAATAGDMAPRWRGRFAFHSSGALTSDLLAPFRTRGAAVASVHPMMTFVGSSSPSLAGVSFALEGDPAAVRAARRIVADVGGDAFSVPPTGKTLYHAMGSFSSPLVVATLALAERVGKASGMREKDIRRIIGPILAQTLKNYRAGGAAKAFSGPIVRADIHTIRRHLHALEKLPAAREAYLALARSALETMPVRNRRALREVLR